MVTGSVFNDNHRDFPVFLAYIVCLVGIGLIGLILYLGAIILMSY